LPGDISVFYIWNAVLLASHAWFRFGRPEEQKVGDDYNPMLAAVGETDNRKGSEATIEDLARVENLRWQTRPAPLTPEESALADALERIFADEVYGLDGVVERLNRMRIAPPAGASAWSDKSFRAEMRRLADLTGGS